MTGLSMTIEHDGALKAGHIKGPYVTAGLSLGGDESLLQADREPTQVVGMVLLDPSFPDQVAREQEAETPALRAWDESRASPFIPLVRKCAAGLRAGTLRPGGPDPDGCLHLQWPPNFPPELRAALDKALAEATPDAIASGMETMIEGARLNRQNSKLVINPRRNYGDMPLVVLSAELPPPDLPPQLRADATRVEAAERRGHQAIAALSTRGVERLVPGSPHDIASYNPRLVIDTIDEVVDEARAKHR